MVLLYSEKITPRIKYIAQTLFLQILKTEVLFTTNSAEFRKSDLPKINYSLEKFNDELYLKPHKLMHTKALITPTINPVWYNNEKYFFESSKDSFLPFDPLAAAFYLITRHEEWTEKSRDKLGRFQPENSILAKYNLLQKPVVNIWANLLAEKINEKYPEFSLPKKEFKFISTIDIDNAWAFKNKGFLRTFAALLKSVVKGNFSEFGLRLKVLSGKENDPYNSYKYIDSVFKGNREKVKFFFLLGDYGRLDKNVSYKNRALQKLIRKTKEKYDVGIHPSFKSAQKKGKKRVEMEKNRLESILKNPVNSSRQHFLQLRFPRTYRRLIAAGITEDYTMGYSSQPGFRAGICTPYYFYDLKKEKTTNLLIVPFQVMDGTLRHYLKLSPDEAFTKIEKIMAEVKNVGGTFVSIWHNETVNNFELWEGYQQVFKKMNQLGFKWANE
jgi:hypothetical protein